MGRIKAMLPVTSESEIFLTSVVMNLDKMMEEELKEIREKYRINRGSTA